MFPYKYPAPKAKPTAYAVLASWLSLSTWISVSLNSKSKLIREKPWCWERLKAGGKRDDRGWDGWMASLTPWTGVWANSGRWWSTGKPGVLQSTGSQRADTTQQPNNNKGKTMGSFSILHFCTVSIHPWSKSYRTSLKNVSWPCPSPPPPAQARTPSSLTDLSTFNFFSSFNSILSPHSRKVNYNVNLINTTQNITQKLDHVIPPLKTP